MDPLALVAATGPPLVFLLAARGHVGFVRQPGLVMAREPARFDSRVADAGGSEVVRTGVGIDLGFIAVLTVPSGLVLLASDRPGLVAVPLVAAVLDLVEDALLLRALREPGRAVLRALAGAALAKYAAYVVLVGAVSWAVVRG